MISATAEHARAIEGLGGATVRPEMVRAKVSGCKVAKTGTYKLELGSLIELNYSYTTMQGSIPKKVGVSMPSGSGAVAPSMLGIRSVETPNLVGVETIAFYFEAGKSGTQPVKLLIDREEYDYTFEVDKSGEADPSMEVAQGTACQVQPIKIRVAGKEDFKVHRIEVLAEVPATDNEEFASTKQTGKDVAANGRIVFYGPCLEAKGLAHWGDCTKHEGSFSMEVRVARRFEADPSGLNRPGYVIRAVTPTGLGPIDADGKVLFFNGPPRTASCTATANCPYRLVINTKEQDEVVQSISMEPLCTVKTAAAAKHVEPAAEVPAPDPRTPFFPIVYFFGKSSCDFAGGELRLFLGDFPKALLFRLRADAISSDANFYYCREHQFDREWAFAKMPEDNYFEPHAVWNRAPGKDWQLYAPDASLASPR